MRITHNGKGHIIKYSVWERYLKTAMKDLEYDTIEDWNKEEIENHAKEIWLDDEGYTQNEEQEELVKKTSGQRLKLDKKVSKPKETKEKSKKIDTEKVEIIEIIRETLTNQENITEIVIENAQKLISFKINDNEYKLNLTKTRKKKG